MSAAPDVLGVLVDGWAGGVLQLAGVLCAVTYAVRLVRYRRAVRR